MTDYNFLYMIRPAAGFDPHDPTPEQQAKLGEHFRYLQGLLANGSLLLAGRSLEENTFGIVIFHADDAASAHEIMLNDPAVMGGVMDAELHSYRVALLAGRD